jgi:hypothetical protein
MLSIYMDNFRGFKNTLIPLTQTTFLVGENSTGKSSLLKLLNLFSAQRILNSTQIAFDDDLGSFADIVSAGATDKTSFRIGCILSDSKEQGLGFTVLTFVNKEDVPELSRYVRYTKQLIVTIIVENDRRSYRVINYDSSKEDFKSAFFNALSLDANSKKPFKPFSERDTKYYLLTHLVVQAIINESKNTINSLAWSDTVFPYPFVYIGPIRSKPNRFYDGRKQHYTPEGDHIPHIIRKAFTNKNKSKSLAKKLSVFGQASGLFETVIVQSFDNSPQAPFQLLVKFGEVDLNINNVGYGISQVLPLIVEFLSRETVVMFAVQQPEVHLHPKAQAALGDLIYTVAKESLHSFVLETHSDYLIDRLRLAMHRDSDPPTAQVLYFRRTGEGNEVDIIKILPDGRYDEEQPQDFREFFIREEIAKLDI